MKERPHQHDMSEIEGRIDRERAIRAVDHHRPVEPAVQRSRGAGDR